jgi:hypothetical protein
MNARILPFLAAVILYSCKGTEGALDTVNGAFSDMDLAAVASTVQDIMQYDLDQDGEIGIDEILAGVSGFLENDVNGDDAVDLAEAWTMAEQRRGADASEAELQQAVGEIMERDTDGNDLITRAELEADLSHLLEGDENGDGKLDAAEVQAIAEHLVHDHGEAGHAAEHDQGHGDDQDHDHDADHDGQ